MELDGLLGEVSPVVVCRYRTCVYFRTCKRGGGVNKVPD